MLIILKADPENPHEEWRPKRDRGRKRKGKCHKQAEQSKT
jgi:hypothetical protein